MGWSSVRLPGVDDSTVVLGAGGAIGGETCRAVAAAGATVVPVTRTGEHGAQLADARRRQRRAASRRPGRFRDLAPMVDDLLARDLPPTVLVNSAAVRPSKTDLGQVTREQFRRLYEVNVVAGFEAIKGVSALGCASAGAAVSSNVASVAAHCVLPSSGIYGLAQSRDDQPHAAPGRRLGTDGIIVNSVRPGQTPTRLRAWDEPPGRAPELMGSTVDTSGIPLRRPGRLEDYAGAVLFLWSSLADYLTGVAIAVEGGSRLVCAKSY